MNVYCRICGEPGAACGDSHQSRPLLNTDAFFKGATMTQDDKNPKDRPGLLRGGSGDSEPKAPQKLEEYHYYVGYMETTAMMTPEMAEQVGAVPIDEPLDEPDGGKKGNNEANRLSTRSRSADDDGVDNDDNKDAQEKARGARNKRATGSGARTPEQQGQQGQQGQRDL